MAISPMVIDVLNMPEQMKRQVECFGGPSEQIRPYVARNLVPIPDTEKAKRLWQWVDPWTYRAKFTMPKLILLGNNDRYWAPDALNIYWDGLPGPKWICYTPNAGHDLTVSIAGIKNPLRAIQTNAAFVRMQLSGLPMPELTWKHDDAGEKLRLTVTCKPAPKEIRVWSCNAPTKDLRTARWESQAVEMKDGVAEILQARPTTGVSAFFADTTYEVEKLQYNLSTQLRMIEAK
jgi:PhoPQ-activated pathogenicity-related protein